MTELPTVWIEGTHKARKLQRCCECDGEIPPGEVYHKYSGLWDGEWRVFKTCIECQILRYKVIMVLDHPDDCPAFEHLYEEVFESRRSNPEWVQAYMDTRRKRNAPESLNGWMERREKKLKEKKEGQVR